MKTTVMMLGKTQSAHLEAEIQVFLKRVEKMAPVEWLEVAPPKQARGAQPADAKRLEGLALMAKVPSGAYLVLLDENGRALNSLAFADYLGQHMSSGIKHLCLCIGGAYGFSDELRAQARDKLSLSAMTFSHQLVRLLLAEQLYRGLSILKGLPYHNP